MSDLFSAIGYGAAYGLLGTVVLALAWLVLDVLTPGKLGDQLKTSQSAGLVAATWMVAQGAIIFTAIWTNASSGFGDALLWTISFSILGVLMQTIAFRLVDLVTPGRLGEEITVDGETQPLAKLASAVIIAVALIVIASIS